MKRGAESVSLPSPSRNSDSQPVVRSFLKSRVNGSKLRGVITPDSPSTDLRQRLKADVATAPVKHIVVAEQHVAPGIHEYLR